MSKHVIFALDDDKASLAFLEDYFSDTHSELLQVNLKDPKQGRKQEATQVISESFKRNPNILFVNLAALTVELRKAIESFFAGAGKKIFLLDNHQETSPLNVSSKARPLDKPLDIVPFQERVFQAFSFPQKIVVLVIDDEPEVCRGIKEFLEYRRDPAFEVDFALNGLEGFKKIENKKPDIVILDIKMPVKSGHDFYREVQKRYHDLPIIILTAAVAAEEIAEIRKAGSPAFVEKGSQASAFPELLTLIKKQWLFS